MIVLVALRTPHPPRILLAFLIGGLVTCIAISGAVIHVLRQSALIEEHQRTTDPVVSLVYVVMFAFVEIPLLGYLFAPERTTDAVQRFDVWLSEKAGLLATGALLVGGVYFVLRGLIGALA
jgi:Sap-like sulfolipid-1-addressing protein